MLFWAFDSARLVGTELCAGRVWCVVSGQFNLARRSRPTRPQTYNPNPNRFGGLEVGRGSHVAPPKVLVAFSQRNSVRLKGQPRPIIPAPCSKFCANQSCTEGESRICYPGCHIRAFGCALRPCLRPASTTAIAALTAKAAVSRSSLVCTRDSARSAK